MRLTLLTAVGVTALAITMVAAPAQAATTQLVRQSDFIATAGVGDTRLNGSYDFLREGLHVVTTSNTAAAGQPANNKAAEYFPSPSSALPTSGSYEWYGTVNQPGAQIRFDTDGDRTNPGSLDNTLVGEQVYSSNAPGAALTEWWYPGGTTRADGRGITCPSRVATYGYDCHGSLAAWAQLNPTVQTFAYGFSLGSGVVGDGALRALTFGDVTYEFTDTPAAANTTSGTGATAAAGATTTTTATATVPARVDITTGSVIAKKNKALGRVRVKFNTAPLTAGTVEGAKIAYVVKADGRRVFQAQLGSGQKAVHLSTFNRTGKHVVTVLANGNVVKKVKITS